MIQVTWNSKKVTVYKNQKPVYSVYLYGRDPHVICDEVYNLLKLKRKLYLIKQKE